MKPKENKPAVSNAGYDKCQTPIHALNPLWEYIDRFDDPRIWESACGEKILANTMDEKGYRVSATDIEQGIDFFDQVYYERDKPFDIQITNPPYSMKYKWIEHSYYLQIPFALLLPLETLGAKKAQNMFAEKGIQIIVLSRRINFKMPNMGWDGKGAQFPVAWFCWQFNLSKDIMYWNFDKGIYV